MVYLTRVLKLIIIFIDEVSKYRQYDENGEEILGEYGGKIFEEEFECLRDKIDNSNTLIKGI